MNHKIHLRLRRSLSAVLALMIVLLTGCANQAAQTGPYRTTCTPTSPIYLSLAFFYPLPVCQIKTF